MSKYNLDRFISAQIGVFDKALSEIKSGRKQTHWIWFIFPQIKDLGMSYNSQFYGIENLEEAKEYLSHPILGRRLVEISKELLKLNTNDPVAIFGEIDAMKLHSSITLFSLVKEAPDVFTKVLNKFFSGKLDEKTLKILNIQNNQNI